MLTPLARRSVTDDLDIRSARSLSLDERANLFNAAYEGYLVPFHLDTQQLQSMDEAFDLDLGASRVAFRDGEPIGLGNLGVRGEDAWIGGIGVVPAARRKGIGEALMRELHEQGRGRGASFEALHIGRTALAALGCRDVPDRSDVRRDGLR